MRAAALREITWSGPNRAGCASPLGTLPMASASLGKYLLRMMRRTVGRSNVSASTFTYQSNAAAAVPKRDSRRTKSHAVMSCGVFLYLPLVACELKRPTMRIFSFELELTSRCSSHWLSCVDRNGTSGVSLSSTTAKQNTVGVWFRTSPVGMPNLAVESVLGE